MSRSSRILFQGWYDIFIYFINHKCCQLTLLRMLKCCNFRTNVFVKQILFGSFFHDLISICSLFLSTRFFSCRSCVNRCIHNIWCHENHAEWTDSYTKAFRIQQKMAKFPHKMGKFGMGIYLEFINVFWQIMNN